MRAAVYARLSRKPETDDNIEQQKVRGQALVVERGWTLVGTFVDDGISAYKEDAARPAWTSLLDSCTAGDVDVIVARDSDRLSRNWDDYAKLVRSGAKVLTWAEGSGHPVDPDDTEGAVRAMMSRSYSKRLSKNRALAEERRVAKGAPPPGGYRHYGYHRYCCDTDPPCAPHSIKEDEAAVLREVAQRWLDGEPMRALAKDVNGRGLRTTADNEWTYRALKKTLLSPRLAGYRVHRGEEHRGWWEPIFDEQLHSRLVAADSRAGNRRAPERYLLTGLLFCGECSDPDEDKWVRLNGHMHRPDKRRYACLTCHRNGIGAEPVEDALWNAALGRTWERDRAAERQTTDRLRDVERELRGVRERLDELDDDYWQRREIPKRTYTRQSAALHDRIARLEDEARQLRRQRERSSGFWNNLLAMVEHYEDATPIQRRALLEGAVHRIVLRKTDQRGGPRVDLSRVRVAWRDGEVATLSATSHGPARSEDLA